MWAAGLNPLKASANEKLNVALVLVVGLDGTPLMLAPEGTSAPISIPFGPVPTQGDPACSANICRMFPAVIPLVPTNSGSELMLLTPGWTGNPCTQLNERVKKKPATAA